MHEAASDLQDTESLGMHIHRVSVRSSMLARMALAIVFYDIPR